jgi:hypothetical protein
MRHIIADVVWDKSEDHFDQWSFIVDQDKDVVYAYQIKKDKEPLRMYAWSLLHPENYVQFLNTILQRFHTAKKNTLVPTRSAIVLVQNEFAKALSSAINHKELGNS